MGDEALKPSDLQARLNLIEQRVKVIEQASDSEGQHLVSELASLLGYLTVIVRKHLRTDER